MMWREAGAHEEVGNDEHARHQTRTRPHRVTKSERRVQRIVEHDRVDDGPEGGAGGDDGHSEDAAPAEVVGDDGDGRKVDEPCTDAGAYTLAEQNLEAF